MARAPTILAVGALLVVLRARTWRLGWNEVRTARVHQRPGIADPGFLDLELCNGAACAIPVNHQSELARVLAGR